MKKSLVLTLYGAMAGAALFAGCASEPSDEEAILQIIEEDKERFFTDNETIEGGGTGLAIGGGDAEATLPAGGWSREIGTFEREIEIQIDGGSWAVAKITDTIGGRMYVDRTNNNKWDPKEKSFKVIACRYASFFKNDYDDWLLSLISPIHYRCRNNDERTVYITSVTVDCEGYSSETFTDWEEPVLHGLRVVDGNDVTVTVYTTNTSAEGWDPPTFAFLHHDGKRELMTDLGGGAFTKTYQARYTTSEDENRQLGISLLDAACLQNETADDYNGDSWSYPIIVLHQ